MSDRRIGPTLPHGAHARSVKTPNIVSLQVFCASLASCLEKMAITVKYHCILCVGAVWVCLLNPFLCL